MAVTPAEKWGPPCGQDDWAAICQALHPCIDRDEWRDMHATLREVARFIGIERRACG